MYGKLLKSFLLFIICTAFISCSQYSRDIVEGRMVDKLTDTALNSDSTKKESSKSSAKGNSSRKKGSYEGRATGDEHYIDDDIYFVSKDPFKGSGWIYVQTAREVTPASSKTKNEGEFMLVHNGEEIWTKNYWRTRIASEKEIKIGTIIIAFNNNDDGIYVSPENKEDALNDSWFMAKVTDLSNKYRGYVIVSGGYKVSMENMRIIKK